MPPLSFSATAVPLDYRLVLGLKAFLAASAACLLWLSWREQQTARALPLASQRSVALALVGILSLAAWWEFGRLHAGGGYLHLHEFYHYYLGAKYHGELGYSGLYRCTAIADAEAGHSAEVEARWVRNLVTNSLEPGSTVVADPDACKRHFSDARWQAFRADIAWFRSNTHPKKWTELPSDHGFNASPVWTLAGSTLANLAPASKGAILSLSLLDPLLLVTMWGVAWWAFGWRAAVVGAVFWGTNYLGRYNWTGGAFLRADWLFLMVTSVALARRGWHRASGFALAWSALLRVFPALLAVGLVLREGWDMWRRRSLRPSSETMNFGTGFALAVLLLMPLSNLAANGSLVDLRDWRAFAENSRKHLATPLNNSMGLKTVVSFDPRSRTAVLQDLWLDSPWDTWKAARQRTFESRRWLFGTLVVAFVALLAFAAATTEPWVALVLGAGLVAVISELTCYYYAFLAVYAFLWTRKPWVGVGLCVLALFTGLLTVPLEEADDTYMAASALVLLFIGAVTAAFARRPSNERAQSPTSAGT